MSENIETHAHRATAKNQITIQLYAFQAAAADKASQVELHQPPHQQLQQLVALTTTSSCSTPPAAAGEEHSAAVTATDAAGTSTAMAAAPSSTTTGAPATTASAAASTVAAAAAVAHISRPQMQSNLNIMNREAKHKWNVQTKKTARDNKAASQQRHQQEYQHKQHKQQQHQGLVGQQRTAPMGAAAAPALHTHHQHGAAPAKPPPRQQQYQQEQYQQQQQYQYQQQQHGLAGQLHAAHMRVAAPHPLATHQQPEGAVPGQQTAWQQQRYQPGAMGPHADPAAVPVDMTTVPWRRGPAPPTAWQQQHGLMHPPPAARMATNPHLLQSAVTAQRAWQQQQQQ